MSAVFYSAAALNAVPSVDSVNISFHWVAQRLMSQMIDKVSRIIALSQNSKTETLFRGPVKNAGSGGFKHVR
jgi:hypothetical protein